MLKLSRILLLTVAVLKKQLHTIRTWRRWSVCFTLGGLLAFALTGEVLFGPIDGWDRPSAEDVVTVNDEPHRVRPLVQPLFSRSSSEAHLVSSLLKKSSSVPLDGSVLCHLLRVYALETMPHPRFSSGMEIVQVLTDETLSKKHLGQSLLFQTRHGIRYRLPSPKGPSSEDGESHRDLFLATFAELGLSLSTPMRTATGSFKVRDLLQDSVQNFDLKQQEIAWTAIAYCLYLPQQKEWHNRDGESFTFDDLATELVQRPFRESSCGGTHLLYAMTLLVRVNSVSPCLSASTREVIIQRLRESVSVAVASQTNEGYWNLEWNQTKTAVPAKIDTLFYRLLVTGHLVELMQYLPGDLQPSAEVYRRAAGWLCSELGRMQDPMERRMFCPWTHSICSVRNLVGETAEANTKHNW